MTEEDLYKISDAVASVSEDQWNTMEAQHKAVVEALQSNLQVPLLKFDTLQASVDKERSVQASADKARLVQTSLPSTTIIATIGSRVYTLPRIEYSLDLADLCSQVHAFSEVGLDLARFPSRQLHTLHIFISTEL